MNVVYIHEKWGRVGGGGALLGVVSGGISSGNVRAATEVALRVAVCSKIKDLFLNGALLYLKGKLCYFYCHTGGILEGRLLSKWYFLVIKRVALSHYEFR